MHLTQTRRRWFAPILLAAVMLAQVVTHLAWLPISTKVGQLAIPWLMSKGLPMFDRLIENRPPATAGLLALIYRLLPSVEPVYIVRALNLLLVLGLTLLIYDLARRLSGSTLAGICAMLFWALWEPVYGNVMFYFDTLVGATFALTVWVWLITEKRQPGWLAPLLAGLLLGGATLFKQPAWAGVILFGLWLVIAARRGRQLPAFVIGVLIFPVLTAGIFAAQGTLGTYLFWNYRRYFSGIPAVKPLTGNALRKFLLTDILAPAFLLQTLRSPNHRNRWLVLALWFAGGADLLPGFDEIYAMAHLPLLSVMSGMALAAVLDFEALRAPLRWFRQASSASLMLAGLALATALGWGWTIAATYVPGPLGIASIPAYDEFRPVAARLLELRQPGDTLWVLPLADGNPQLYPLTGMLPPGRWMTSHHVFLDTPGVSDKLVADLTAHPPDIIVDFPWLHVEFEPGLLPLEAYLKANFHLIDQVKDVPFNGDALIYRRNGDR